MKRSSALTRVFRLGILGVALVCGVAQSAHAALLTVTASQSNVSVGGGFSVYFGISGLGAAPGSSLSGFDLNVLYDASVMQLSGYDFIDPASALHQLDLPEAGSPGSFGSASASGGVIDAFDLSGNSQALLDALQADDFRFLTLNFTSLAATTGSSIAVDLLDPDLLFLDSAGDLLPLTFRTSSASIVIDQGAVTVPEPSALLLVFIALFGGAWAMRRKLPPATLGLALMAAVASTESLAQVPASPAASAVVPVAAGTPFDAVVLEVAGMRLKVKTSDGRTLWVTVPGAPAADKVGMRLQGTARQRGDTVQVANPVFAPKP